MSEGGGRAKTTLLLLLPILLAAPSSSDVQGNPPASMGIVKTSAESSWMQSSQDVSRPDGARNTMEKANDKRRATAGGKALPHLGGGKRNKLEASKLEGENAALTSECLCRAKHTCTLCRWRRQYLSLMLFRQNLGHADVPFEWKGDKLLARWSNEQQRHFKAGSLSPSHRSLLTRAGLRFSRSTGWCDQLAELLEFRQAQGHCSVPLRWSVNRPLGAWLARQRLLKRNARLHPAREGALASAGVEWTVCGDQRVIFPHHIQDLGDSYVFPGKEGDEFEVHKCYRYFDAMPGL